MYAVMANTDGLQDLKCFPSRVSSRSVGELFMGAEEEWKASLLASEKELWRAQIIASVHQEWKANIMIRHVLMLMPLLLMLMPMLLMLMLIPMLLMLMHYCSGMQKGTNCGECVLLLLWSPNGRSRWFSLHQRFGRLR